MLLFSVKAANGGITFPRRLRLQPELNFLVTEVYSYHKCTPEHPLMTGLHEETAAAQILTGFCTSEIVLGEFLATELCPLKRLCTDLVERARILESSRSGIY